MRDRIDAITDLLLGAAYADDHLHDREKQTIHKLLERLAGGELSEAVMQQIETFDAAARAAEFANASALDKRKLLNLIVAVHEADQEFDLAEDDYLKAVAEAIGAGEAEISGLTLDYEVEELQQDLAAVRAVPPPIPGTEVDVDI
jgi:uncharacterized tellurite resistance protein B-like protein